MATTIGSVGCWRKDLTWYIADVLCDFHGDVMVELYQWSFIFDGLLGFELTPSCAM
jgi:hypothetical protein